MFPQGLEPCCFPLPEGRLGFSFLYVALCIPGDTESTSTGLLRRQRCRPCSLCPHQLPWAEPAVSLLPACHTGLPLPCMSPGSLLRSWSTMSCVPIILDMHLLLPRFAVPPGRCLHQQPLQRGLQLRHQPRQRQSHLHVSFGVHGASLQPGRGRVLAG